jgi:ABC-2 type transport system ATP-binding protein
MTPQSVLPGEEFWQSPGGPQRLASINRHESTVLSSSIQALSLPPTAMQLSIRNLSKRYANGVQALDNVSLDIAPGMFGLLGPNGAGKSTLMRTLATLQEADSGTVKLDDIDVLREKDRVRRVLGYLPQEFGVYPKVAAWEMLDHFARLKGLTDSKQRKATVDALLERTNLAAVRKQRLGGFSGGMRQRFGIAQALLGNPKLIIVDEPTAGLDPEERVRFHNLLAEIGTDVIVILSTHIVDDVADLCPRFAVISKGRLLLTGEPRDAVEGLHGKIWRRVVAREELAAVQSSLPIISTRLQSGHTVVRAYAPAAPAPGFEAVEAELEDVYFSAVAGHLAPQPLPAAA